MCIMRETSQKFQNLFKKNSDVLSKNKIRKNVQFNPYFNSSKEIFCRFKVKFSMFDTVTNSKYMRPSTIISLYQFSGYKNWIIYEIYKKERKKSICQIRYTKRYIFQFSRKMPNTHIFETY